MLAKVISGGLLVAALVSAAGIDLRIPNAAKQGDREAVKTLIDQNADLNAALGDGTTALHWAAYADDIEMVRTLLAAGAKTSITTRVGGLTPLFIAAQKGSARIVEALLKAGEQANEKNSNGTTVLMMAAASGNADSVRLLIANGAQVNAVENTNGQTALMFAAALNRDKAVQALLRAGADPKITTKAVRFTKLFVDDNGNTIPPPGSAAAATPGVAGAGSTATAPAAAANAAANGKSEERPRARNGGGSAGATVQGGMTALHFAAREGGIESVRALIAGGADVNEVTTADQTTPLVEALINGRLDIAKLLLDQGANANLANADGMNPLYAVVDIQWAQHSWYPEPTVTEEKTNYLDLMKELLDQGANPNAKLARKLWYRKFRYADDWVDPNGATPLWRAAQSNDVAAMKLLVAAGADPKIATAHGCTPLMVAAGYGYQDQVTNLVPNARLSTVRYLIEDLGGDVNARDDEGYTALHGAAYTGENDLVTYLVNKGADVKARAKSRQGSTGKDAPDGKGDTVADMANGPREKSLLHPDTVALLESLGSENSHDCRSTACVLNTRPDKPVTAPK